MSGGVARGGDEGAVTVEAALALATLTVFVALAAGALMAVIQTVRCVDAARELARLAARGEPDRGRGVAREQAPAGARLELTTDGDTLVAVVTAPLASPLPVTVSGRAVAAREGPGVGPGDTDRPDDGVANRPRDAVADGRHRDGRVARAASRLPRRRSCAGTHDDGPEQDGVVAGAGHRPRGVAASGRPP